MPWNSDIDPSLRLIYTRVSGVLRRDEAVAHRAELAADPRFDPTFDHVLDLQDVVRVDLTTSDLVQLAGHSILAAPSRQAIIAPADVSFGISRMYYAYRQQYPNHEEITVCRTLSDARGRLGIDRPSDPRPAD